MSEPERVVPLLVTQAFRLLRITSEGHRSPPGFWYDQDEHEWVTLVAGEAELAFEDGARRALSVGEPCYIEARRKHRVVATSAEGPTVWLALFFRETPLDPLPEDHIARIVGHMNDDHADSLLDYATVLADVPDARAARMTGIDAAGFDVEAETPIGPRQLRFAFEAPIANAKDARVALVDLAKRARP